MSTCRRDRFAETVVFLAVPSSFYSSRLSIALLQDSSLVWNASHGKPYLRFLYTVKDENANSMLALGER